jgi:hypothetical protein
MSGPSSGRWQSLRWTTTYRREIARIETHPSAPDNIIIKRVVPSILLSVNLRQKHTQEPNTHRRHG